MTARIPALALGALLLGSTLGAVLPAVAAEPTLHEVYQAVQAGRLTEADRMMDEVLRAHPGSAKAHYVEAELLAKENRTDAARAELAQAERLDASLSFAKASSVAELRQRLAQSGTGVLPAPARSSSMAAPTTPVREAAPQGGGLGAIWIILLVGLVMFVIVRVVRGMRPPAGPTIINQGPVGPYGGMPGGQPGYGPGPGPGYGGQPGYGAPMGGGFGGGGLMGSLATGAAVGAGVIAGEALMHRVIDGPEHGRSGGSDFIPSAEAAPLPPANYDAGGQDFGVNDTGSWDSGSSGGGDSGGDSW